MIHKDSSGTELLRYEDLSEYFSEVEVDPMSAIIRDSVQGYTGIIGTTILRPLKSKFFLRVIKLSFRNLIKLNLFIKIV